MNTKNSKTNEIQKFILNLSQRLIRHKKSKQEVDEDLGVCMLNLQVTNTLIYYFSLIWKFFWKSKTQVFNAPVNE